MFPSPLEIPGMDIFQRLFNKQSCYKMDLTENKDVDSDVETLIRIILLTQHKDTLFHIIDSLGNDEALIDLMESSGDVDTLKHIIELTEYPDDPKGLYSERTFSQEELDTALISACRHGYTFLVNEIVDLGADVHTRDEYGETLLLICVEHGFTNIARLLTEIKVNINATNNVGDTALILVAGPADSIEMVKLLLAQVGINVNHQNKEGYTALMEAVEAKNIDAIKLLLDSQENATEGLEGIKNCRNETAQDIADKLGIGSAIKFLIRYRAEMYNPLLAAVLLCDEAFISIWMTCKVSEPLDKKFIIQNSFRAMFAKHEICGENFSKIEEMIIQKLLQFGADVNDCPDSSNPVLVATKVGSYNVLKILCKHGANFHRLPSWILTSLLAISAEHGRAHIIKLLLKHHQSLAAKNCTTPALIHAMKNEHRDCIKLLRKHNASLDIKFAFKCAVKNNDYGSLRYLVGNYKVGINHTFPDDSMNNFVVSAARNGRIDIIGLLLDAGANVNCVSSDKKTPLTEAKNAEVVNFLVQRGAVVNMNTTEHDMVYSPLLYVLYHYSSDSAEEVKIVEALLNHGAPVNEDCGHGSPLMIAIINGADKDVIQLLLDYGADVNVKDVSGNNALMLAVSSLRHNPEILTILIQAGCDINAQNDSGYSPLMLAAKVSCKEALMLLVDSGADVNAVSESKETALSLTMKYFYPSTICVEYLLVRGARASYLKPEFIILMILENKFKFIPKLIHHGLGPTEISLLNILPAHITTVSPFCMALMIGNVKLASYFVDNLFVTKSDMFQLIHNKDLRQYLHTLELRGCLSLLDKQSAQPLSLFSMAFIAVQSAVGAAPGREDRVRLLPLPQVIKDRLMFKTESLPLNVSNKRAKMADIDSVITEIEKSVRPDSSRSKCDCSL